MNKNQIYWIVGIAIVAVLVLPRLDTGLFATQEVCTRTGPTDWQSINTLVLGMENEGVNPAGFCSFIEDYEDGLDRLKCTWTFSNETASASLKIIGIHQEVSYTCEDLLIGTYGQPIDTFNGVKFYGTYAGEQPSGAVQLRNMFYFCDAGEINNPYLFQSDSIEFIKKYLDAVYSCDKLWSFNTNYECIKVDSCPISCGSLPDCHCFSSLGECSEALSCWGVLSGGATCVEITGPQCLSDNAFLSKESCEAQGPYCPAIWVPICGEDGTTYSSECNANLEGVDVDYEGECDDCITTLGETCIKLWMILVGIGGIVLVYILGGKK